MLALLIPLGSQAASPDQPERWAVDTYVNVREAPHPDSKKIGELWRGAKVIDSKTVSTQPDNPKVILKTTIEPQGDCLIEYTGYKGSQGHIRGFQGYVACEQLKPLRWVLADDVRVRETPSPDGKVIGVLLRGAELVLKTMTELEGYCDIEVGSFFGTIYRGHVACQYLSTEPVAGPRA
ncbi:MAG: hypothetical protein FWD50_06265, partial [Betaproteobacteria bacterium]|nr:hypothetical protein [Betaproteobacteria bacterium]